jgi:hypothetical protein
MQRDLRTIRSYANRASHVHPTVDLQIVPQPDIPATRRTRSTEYHKGAIICRVLDCRIASCVSYSGVVVVSSCKVDVGVPGADVSIDIQFPLWIVCSDAYAATRVAYPTAFPLLPLGAHQRCASLADLVGVEGTLDVEPEVGGPWSSEAADAYPSLRDYTHSFCAVCLYDQGANVDGSEEADVLVSLLPERSQGMGSRSFLMR